MCPPLDTERSIARAITDGYGARWAPPDLLKAVMVAVLAVSSVKLLKTH